MANTRSAKKMVRKIARRTELNAGRRTRMRGYVRKVEEAIASGNQDDARKALGQAQSELAKASNNGIVHKNMASRKVSRLNARIKAMSA